MAPITEFIKHHYRHFNAAALVDAAEAYNKLLADGGKMFVTIAGAMSTAELGLSLAEMIRQDKIHGICCTGANLEEDVFNLVAHNYYERVPRLSRPDSGRRGGAAGAAHEPRDGYVHSRDGGDAADRERGAGGVGEGGQGRRAVFSAPVHVQDSAFGRARRRATRSIPKNSWLLAAAEKNLPMFVPGWEDATLGNMYAGHCITGDVKKVHTVRTGIEYMMELAEWYTETTAKTPLGFFQIGGGIAGDFPICVVPMLHQDLQREHVPLWAYFCQISDSTTSYGSYSGAVPNEKITWGKLGEKTPKFIIESDASIVAPLVFAYVLGW